MSNNEAPYLDEAISQDEQQLLFTLRQLPAEARAALTVQLEKAVQAGFTSEARQEFLATLDKLAAK